ncbi:MAG: hypothetical protein GXN91_04345 [Epsilonproteobacteria bacterium]|nr:hypothetical protein [Campylobacterota bacterium]
MKRATTLLIGATIALLAKGVELAPAEPIAVTPTPSTNLESLISHGASLKIGTLGVGADFEHMFNKKHGVRLNVNGIKISRDEELDDITYDLDLKLFTAGILYDYHPWEGSFRVTTGLYYNNNKLEGTARPTSPVTIGDRTYQPDQIGQIDAKIDFENEVAPYVGIGWSSTEKNGWHFTADIGVMYAGEPQVWAQATPGPALQDQPDLVNQLQQDIEKERQNIYEDIKDYKWWPVIMIGVQKKF